MRKKTKYGLIIVVLAVILGVGFGIYRDEILGRYAQHCFYRGEKHFEAEKYEKATKYLKTSLRFNPDNPGTHLLLMKTYWARGLWEEMREERDKIIALGEEAPPLPLVIKDLESMYIATTRSSDNEGYIIIVEDDLISYGSIADNLNVFNDENTSKNPLPIELYITPSGEDYVNLPADYSVELTYDSGQEITVCCPKVINADDIDLYIASDGSTYYDKWLTKLAQKVPISSGEGRR